MRRYLTSWKWWLLGLLVVIVVVGACNAILGRGGSNSDSGVKAPTATVESQPPKGEWIEDVLKDVILDDLRSETLVKDAAIAKDGNKVSLALIVNAAVDEAHAKQLGDNFVRQVKAMSDDETPGKEIGTGKYDYLVTIGYGDQVLHQGAKASGSERITW